MELRPILLAGLVSTCLSKSQLVLSRLNETFLSGIGLETKNGSWRPDYSPLRIFVSSDKTRCLILPFRNGETN